MKSNFILILFLFCLNVNFGQDFHLSQYDAAALNVNPASTGSFRGDFRFHGHYRSQWQAVATNPFVTGLVSFDTKKDNWGYGGQIANFRAGLSGYNELKVFGSVAYRKKIGTKKRHSISTGVQIGIFQKSISTNKLTFANQYVQADGGSFNTNLSTGETFGKPSAVNLDLSVGVMYSYINKYSRFNPFAGLSVFHLNQPKESFLGSDNKLPIRYLFQVGTRIGITNKLALTPKAFFQYQKKALEIAYGVVGQYYLSNPNFFFLFGVSYRSEKDAAIIELGGKSGNLIGRISYDINVSTLNSISNGRGATELSFTYIINKAKEFPLESCPKIK